MDIANKTKTLVREIDDLTNQMAATDTMVEPKDMMTATLYEFNLVLGFLNANRPIFIEFLARQKAEIQTIIDTKEQELKALLVVAD